MKQEPITIHNIKQLVDTINCNGCAHFSESKCTDSEHENNEKAKAALVDIFKSQDDPEGLKHAENINSIFVCDNYDTKDQSTPLEIPTDQRELLKKAWADNGACRSCGWHAGYSEVQEIIEGAVITNDIEEDGSIFVPCRANGGDDHRGSNIYNWKINE